MTVLQQAPAAHSPHLVDAQYALDVAQGTTLTVNFVLDGPDAAFILGACRERGMAVETAVQEALVEWAQ